VLSIPSASKPGKRVYTVRATDTAGNVSSTIINLDFYTPDSQLTNVSEQSLTGSLSEKLSNIPIHVYRLRSEKTLSLTGMLATEEQ
jgi:hypothetical protein